MLPDKAKGIFRKVLLVAFFILIISPYLSFAQGLVPCGNEGQRQCTYKDLFTLADKVINFLLFKIAIPLAVLMVIWGGINILTSAGNEGKVKRGREIITGTFVGIAIAFGAWLIVETIIKVFFKL